MKSSNLIIGNPITYKSSYIWWFECCHSSNKQRRSYLVAKKAVLHKPEAYTFNWGFWFLFSQQCILYIITRIIVRSKILGQLINKVVQEKCDTLFMVDCCCCYCCCCCCYCCCYCCCCKYWLIIMMLISVLSYLNLMTICCT